MHSTRPAPVALSQEVWRAQASAHARRAEELTADARARRARGLHHPVWDFLFTYYPVPPGRLRHWHPGPGTVLLGATPGDGFPARWYRTADTGRGPGVELDAGAFGRERRRLIDATGTLLRHTLANPARFDCFGLHEWAMAFRLPEGGQRHGGVPLRLGRAGTDEVVRTHHIRCTHFDAFRFFTPEARPLNAFAPTRDDQAELDQPGCLHANMDLYKWAYKLSPATPGDLLLDCFELARRLRELDMRASPYDLRDWGLAPVRIETPEGKAEYVAAQRRLRDRADALRRRLLTLIDALRPSW